MSANASQAASPAKSMDEIMSLCKRRGFVYPASEIYGGINGFWDYGPLGAQLKKNLRDAWWQDVVMNPCWGRSGPDGNPVEIVPVDTTIIQNPRVWEASGHLAGFNDPMVQCSTEGCRRLFRADHVETGPVRLWTDSLPTSSSISLEAMEANAQKNQPLFAISRISGEDFSNFISRIKSKIKGKRVQIHEVDMQWGSHHSWPITFIDVDGILYHWGRSPNGVLQPGSPCPNCGGPLGEPRAFNLMFHSYTGAIFDEANKVYLRPETAQGIFVQFKNVIDTTRVGVPFGIAQTGKAFRNEVTPRNFTFRSREFEQMEIEFFCHPDEAKDWYAFWRDWRMEWWKSLGLAGSNLILREHDRDELAHYAKEGAGTSDVEYRFPFTAPGFGELEGIAHRTDFDLRQHALHSGLGDKLKYFDSTRGELAPNGQPKGEKYFPHVIEPSAGLDRGVLAALCEAFTPDPERPSGVYMKFHPRLSPIKAGVFPLVKKDGMPEKAAALAGVLRKKFGHLGTIDLDEKQSIGKRYARMDEAGCPFCFTIDSDTLTDDTVTVRHRDTLQQERIAMDAVPAFLGEKLGV